MDQFLYFSFKFYIIMRLSIVTHRENYSIYIFKFI
jgi:hypothetical protein